MANKRRGEVSLDLGGRTRILKLTLNDFAELQDAYPGETLISILSKLDDMDVKVLRKILHLSLKHDDAELTEAQVGSFDLDIAEVSAALGECISLSLGGGKSSKKK